MKIGREVIKSIISIELFWWMYENIWRKTNSPPQNRDANVYSTEHTW